MILYDTYMYCYYISLYYISFHLFPYIFCICYKYAFVTFVTANKHTYSVLLVNEILELSNHVDFINLNSYWFEKNSVAAFDWNIKNEGCEVWPVNTIINLFRLSLLGS